MIVAIIQARMGSTRLQGKVLKDIVGKPMLWHLINRLKKSTLIERIVVATSTEDINRPICDLAKNSGVESFMGKEDDVLDRYYQAAKQFHADPIIRITADCPLVDPQVVDKAIQYYLDHKEEFDYVSNAMMPTYPDGLDTEVFSFTALKKAWDEARRQSEREYVTSYIWKNGQIFRLANVSHQEDLSFMRWTVDEDKDFLFVTEIYEGLYKNENEIFYMDNIVSFLEDHPELMRMNHGINRNEGYIKSLKEEGVNIEEEFIPWKLSKKNNKS